MKLQSADFSCVFYAGNDKQEVPRGNDTGPSGSDSQACSASAAGCPPSLTGYLHQKAHELSQKCDCLLQHQPLQWTQSPKCLDSQSSIEGASFAAWLKCREVLPDIYLSRRADAKEFLTHHRGIFTHVVTSQSRRAQIGAQDVNLKRLTLGKEERGMFDCL